MTVKELIEELKKVDQEAKVIIDVSTYEREYNDSTPTGRLENTGGVYDYAKKVEENTITGKVRIIGETDEFITDPDPEIYDEEEEE